MLKQETSYQLIPIKLVFLSFNTMQEMKIRIVLSFLYILYSISLIGQTDSLIKISDLQFNSAFEKQEFYKYFNEGKKNNFALFSSINSNITDLYYRKAYSEFSEKVKLFKNEKVQKKKNAKKIKLIKETIHDSFLKKYEIYNSFDEIFKDGEFNCVSGSAIFSLVFEELSIPYIIKEKPIHVYLVAFPNSDRILVEATDPIKGYYIFNNYFKTRAVESLRKSKLISSSEYNSMSLDELFDKYYLTDKDISLEELIGIQYKNDALFSFEKKDYNTAFNQFAKAYLFYPDENIELFMTLTLGQILLSPNYSKIEYLDKLILSERFIGKYIEENNLLADFYAITKKFLIEESNTEKYTKIYNYLIDNLKRESLKNKITSFYYSERGRVLYNLKKYEEALPIYDTLYHMNPKHADYPSLIFNIFSYKISKIDNSIDVLNIVNEYISKYGKEFPFYDKFKTVQVIAYLDLFNQNYLDKNLKKGEYYRELFESNFIKDRDSSLNVSQMIYSAYSNSGVYYFRKGSYSWARKLFKKGLEYLPNNYSLKRRLQALN